MVAPLNSKLKLTIVDRKLDLPARAKAILLRIECALPTPLRRRSMAFAMTTAKHGAAGSIEELARQSTMPKQ